MTLAPPRAMRFAALLLLLAVAAAADGARTPLAAADTTSSLGQPPPPPAVEAASLASQPGRIELVARGRVAAGADDRSYGVQVPPATEAAEGALCRRVDPGGALALRFKRPLPPDAAIGATVGLKLTSAVGTGGEAAGPLTLRAIGSNGSGSGGGVGVSVRGPFASVPLAALAPPGAAQVEGVELARAADASGAAVVCVEDWSVDGAA